MTYSERLNDIAIVKLDTTGFSDMDLKKKKLVYHLSEAGMWGKVISLHQASDYNIRLLDNLIFLFEEVNHEEKVWEQLRDTLFTFFAHGGVYHTTTGERLDFPIQLEELRKIKDTIETFTAAKAVEEILFSKDLMPHYRTVQKDGVDVVKESGANFYVGLTTDEVKQFREEVYPKVEGDEIPPYGFNERLVKNSDGSIDRQVISSVGLYAHYVGKIIKELEKALFYSENEQQKESIETLIQFYKTGDAADFDKHCVAWTKDKESSIYFVNGLIESYKDPLGIACNFESIVAFKDPSQTAKVEKIIENIQWFENNLPFDSKFKKDKAVGLSASSINVISMAGDPSPVLPLGINLPNSDWIRKKHGSKSVTLANVDSSRNTYDVPLMKALYLDKYQALIKRYDNETGVLHTDLHEIAGHGSGKVLDGVNTDVLSTYYSVIEECRADLVALYYIPDEKLKEIGVFAQDVDVKDAALAKYIAYFTNGAIGQLRRIKLGNDLTQAHFRNRQIISTWLLDHAEKDKMAMVTKDGRFYIEVNDLEYVRTLVGVLLSEIQRIKSEGDFEAAKKLVEAYGTKVNPLVHKEVLERVSSLGLANVMGFMTPILVDKGNDVEIMYQDDFLSQHIELYKKYK